MQIVTSTEAENAILRRIGGNYDVFSEMLPEEREFLNTLLLRKRPKKILEVGVSAGGSSVIILNAIRDIGARLHSVDYLAHYYKDSGRATGFVVDEYPELKMNQTLYSGGLACKFMDDIGGEIDFCFIDTMHVLPGEILDFLMVLPYLDDDCTLVFHDTQLHTVPTLNQYYPNALLMSAIGGEKLLAPGRDGPSAIEGSRHASSVSPTTAFPNIGGIIMAHGMRDRVWDIFNLLTLRWSYMPQRNELDEASRHYARFYDNYCVDFFNAIVEHQTSIVNEFRQAAPIRGVRRLKYLFKSCFYSLGASITSDSRFERYRARLAKANQRLGK